jgi:hypothetical protein
MSTFLRVALIDIGVIIASFIIFSAAIPGYKRHIIWEKYISSFAKFVIYIFIATVLINILTFAIVYALRYERYLNIIAPTVQSVLIGFVASCVPRRGVGDKKEEGK